DTEASAASPSAPAETSSLDASGGSPDAPDRTEDSRTVAQRLEDAGVAARVKQALVRTQSLRPFNFASAVIRGRLTLRGNVETREQYRTAERVASSVEGVTDVTNQVTVQGRALSETGDPAEATYHTVRRGDTLWKISREYDVSVRQVRALNDLSESLQPGQRIRVR
ncbi:MAG: N-acetylmuramoyl-L-alanine amidase, partial [Bacteroidetes bacterium QH_1_64_81]